MGICDCGGFLSFGIFVNFSQFCLFNLILYFPVNIYSLMSRQFFLGYTSTRHKIKCLAQKTRCSATGEDQTPNPSILNQ